MQLNILNFTDQETWRWRCPWISHLSQSVSKLTLPALTYTPTRPLIQKLAPKHCMIWKSTNNTFPRVQPKFWNNLSLAVPLTPRAVELHMTIAQLHTALAGDCETRVYNWICRGNSGKLNYPSGSWPRAGTTPRRSNGFCSSFEKGSPSELPMALACCSCKSRASTSSVLLLAGRLSWHPGILSCCWETRQWWQGAEGTDTLQCLCKGCDNLSLEAQ